jgi:dTMP kinase
LKASAGLLIAFEGLDQSGKQTQAELLRDWLTSGGRSVRLLSFPDYQSAIGTEIRRGLRGERDYGADEIIREKEAGTILVCDRYLASSIAYGEAQALDVAWLTEIQKYLPQPDITFLLDIPPDVSARRKTTDRDRYERDLSLLARVRESYLRQAQAGWVRLDATRDKNEIAADVYAAVSTRL